MTAPTAQEQIKFLRDLQTILSEGGFVASYKFALLMAISDLAVELGDDSGAVLTIPTKALAEKFIVYYWPQTAPFGTAQTILRQNTGATAAVLLAIEDSRRTHGESLSAARNSAEGWKKLVQYVENVVRDMPLWKLQTVDGGARECLYPNRPGSRSLELLPGIAACFRQFHEIVGDLVRGAWIRYIRRHNGDVLGNVSDLEEFLFGSERRPFPGLVPVLRDLQAGRCFYCTRKLENGSPHVDHFIPRSRYPMDLGHNFVLAHDSCNLRKSDHLAASNHLANWVRRSEEHDTAIRGASSAAGLIYDLPTSLRVARWAYLRTESLRTQTWLLADRFEPLDGGWKEGLDALLIRLGIPAA